MDTKFSPSLEWDNFRGLGSSDLGTTTFTAQSGFTENANRSHTFAGNQGILSASKVVSTMQAAEFTFDMNQASNPSGTFGWVSTWKQASGGAGAAKRRIIINP